MPPGQASSRQNIAVQNVGTVDLAIGTVALGGADPDQFRKVSVGDFCSGHTLGPSQTCEILFRFKPTSTGAKNATVTIPSNDSNENPVTVALSGTGT